VTIAVPAYLFDRDPVLFCAVDEDAAGSFDAGGQAIASFFPPERLGPSDRAFLAMAWERAFGRRADGHAGLDLVPDAGEHLGDVELPHFGKGLRRGKQKRRKSRKAPARNRAPDRQLLDPDQVEVEKIKVSQASGNSRGKLRIPVRRPLQPAGDSRPAGNSLTDAGAHYNVKEGEEVGFRLMEKYLAARGIQLEDTRAQPNVGADGVDRRHSLYFELKAHGREPSNEIRMQGSEAERAEEMGDKYWLVVASGLERGYDPELLFIPNPLARLDTYYGGGIKLIGINTVTGAKPPRRGKT
jgi:hypothetical protein